jgi:two-component system NtrC family sensor kinase
MNDSIDRTKTETSPTSGQGIAPADLGLLRSMFDSIPGRAVLVDGDFVCRLANREFLDFVGRTTEAVLGRTLAQVLGETVAANYEPMRARLMAGESLQWEGWVDYGAPGRRFVGESVAPYRPGGSGPVAGFIAITRDLTDIRQHALQLAEQEQLAAEGEALHKAVVDTSLDCIIIIDGEGRVVDFNPAAERLFGHGRHEAIGRDISTLIIPEAYRAAHHAGLARYMASGQTRVIGRRVELEALGKDGQLIPVELSLADVSVGAKRFFTAHIRDLTAAKSAQLEIERQRDALYQKEKLAALGSLLSGVAHELNNPLSIVLGQAMMLREKVGREVAALPSAEDIIERALRIETAANRCARIVKTFLAMARQRKAERAYVSIAKVIADAIELLSYSLKTSDVTLAVEIAEPLPETFADADLIHQVLVNLIVNARQALEEMAAGDRRILLAARHDAVTDAIVISLRDNGGGIPAAIRNRIFDPFFTTKPQDHGTGIGLAVSRGLIEAHAGTLELARPQPADGAEFVIRLPVTLRDGSEAEASAASLATIKPQIQAKTVLIVDDEPDLAELIADIVAAQGYGTLIAHSGQAAQHMLSADGGAISAILCDIRMPDGDGPSVYDWLSATRPELMRRIGFVTGDTLGPSAGRFLARTGCPVIEKPFTPDDIGRVLAALASG